MHQFQRYQVQNTDNFDPADYQFVNEEVQRINEQTVELPTFFKSEIIISFLKNHYLHNDWMQANPELTKLVISGSLLTGTTESLFESSHNNPVFRQHLEIYLTKMFS